MPLAVSSVFGGHVAYLAATPPDIKATASFYGAGITTDAWRRFFPQLRTPEINGTLYAFFGMEDASIPPEQVDQIEAELKKYLQPIVFFVTMADRLFFAIIALAIILKPQPMLSAPVWVAFSNWYNYNETNLSLLKQPIRPFHGRFCQSPEQHDYQFKRDR